MFTQSFSSRIPPKRSTSHFNRLLRLKHCHGWGQNAVGQSSPAVSIDTLLFLSWVVTGAGSITKSLPNLPWYGT